MTPKEKAKELTDKFEPYVYCYMGSGMLSNTYDEHVALSMAKKCALIAVDEIINSSPSLPILGNGGTFGEDIELSKKYWEKVKKQIKKL